MEAFEFATAGRILFGAGRSAELPGLLASHGSRALVCTGASPYRHADLLAGLGLPAVVFPVAGEPTVVQSINEGSFEAPGTITNGWPAIATKYSLPAPDGNGYDLGLNNVPGGISTWLKACAKGGC